MLHVNLTWANFSLTLSLDIVQKSDGDKALKDILNYSVFKTEEDLKFQFDLIPEGDEKTGTRIIVSSIRQTIDGSPEFDFTSDQCDIRIPDDAKEEERKYKRQERQNHIPESDYSLRVSLIFYINYCNWRARCKNGLPVSDDFQWLFKILGNFVFFSQLHCTVF